MTLSENFEPKGRPMFVTLILITFGGARIEAGTMHIQDCAAIADTIQDADARTKKTKRGTPPKSWIVKAECR